MSESGVIVAHADISGVENLFRQAILTKLGSDRDALEAFEVSIFTPHDTRVAVALHRLGKRLFDIRGALGLNDSSQGWKAFEMQMEEGLSEAQDKQIAEQLAFQCLKCVAKMKREAGLSVVNLKKQVKQRATQ